MARNASSAVPSTAAQAAVADCAYAFAPSLLLIAFSNADACPAMSVISAGSSPTVGPTVVRFELKLAQKVSFSGSRVG
jgi:hypothetical protein